jgi:branched-chain amino acid transport system substrate-binding protein
MLSRLRHSIFLILLILLSQRSAIADIGLKVGFILPLSGEWALLGEGIRDGALLAQEDLKEAGVPVELYFEDNRGDLATSARLGSKLVNTDKVDALVSIISGVGNLLRPIANQAKILHIGICSEPEVADGNFSFVNYLTAEQGVAKFLAHYKVVMGAQRSLAIFSLNESGFMRIVHTLKKSVGSEVKVVATETFDKGATDFRSMLIRVRSRRPDAVLLLGLSPEIELLARQARALGVTVPFISIEGFGLANDKSPFEGGWFVDSAVPNEEFRERFLQRYERTVTPGVGHSYDTVRMLVHAFRADTRNDALQRFRAISDFAGVTGKLQVQGNGVIWSEASLKVIKNGQPELIQSR